MALRLPRGLTLYFSRHGETVANIEGRFSGKKDTPLTPHGHEQAEEIGELLRREAGEQPSLQFVSSPLQRARTTMEIVRYVVGLPREGYTTDERISEIDLGAWDQLTNAEARVLKEFAELNSPKQIAADLGVSLSTVRSHLKQIHAKAAVTTSLQLLRLAHTFCSN